MLLFCSMGVPANAITGAGLQLGGSFLPLKSSLPQNYDTDKVALFTGMELWWETQAEIDALGVKIGLNYVLDRDYYRTSDSQRNESTVNMWQIPITVYYRYKWLQKIHLRAGAGVTIAQIHWDLRGYYNPGFSPSDTYTGTQKNIQVYPHIDLGIEWGFASHCAVGFDVKYHLGGKVHADWDRDKFGDAYVQLRGWQPDISFRVYF